MGKGGAGQPFVDDALVAEGRIDRSMGFRISLDETFDLGSDAGEPVSEAYHVPFDFPGAREEVDVKPALGGQDKTSLGSVAEKT